MRFKDISFAPASSPGSLDFYIGEPLIWSIRRAKEFGASDESTPTAYDDDDDENFDVDSSGDIRTDRFALAEEIQLTHSRMAASALTDAANSSASVLASSDSSIVTSSDSSIVASSDSSFVASSE